MRVHATRWQALLFAACLLPAAYAHAQAGTLTQQAATKHEADCRAGDAGACWVVGRWYRGGIRLAQDLGKARELLGLGCARRHPDSCEELHELNLEAGTPGQVAEALAYFSARCDAGDGERCLDLANRHARGTGVPVDLAKARMLAGKACGLDLARGCVMAGGMAAEGLGGPVDGKAATQALDRACRGREIDACMALQAIARQGQLIPVDGPLAISAAESACGFQFAEGCLAAATVAYHGLGTLAPDAARVRRNAALACDLKDARGCLMLESLASQGLLGEPRDPAAAAEASRKGCALGNVEACGLAVGHAAATGDKETIGQALLQACHAGLADACVDLAQMLATGDGVDKNTLAAELYLQRALKIDPSHEGAKAAQARLKN